MDTAGKGHLEVYIQYSQSFQQKTPMPSALIFRLNSKGLRRQHFKCY